MASPTTRPVRVRVAGTLTVLVLAGVSIAACSKPSSDLPAYSPQPSSSQASSDASPTRTASAITPPASSAARRTSTPTTSSATKPSVTIDTSRVKSSAVVNGFKAAYTEYFTALATPDLTALRSEYPSFLQDLQDASGKSVIDALASGRYRFFRHGSVTVMSISSVKGLPDTYQVSFCRSPRTQAYNSSTHTYYGSAKGQVATHGYPDAFTMTKGGNGMYYFTDAPGASDINLCRAVTYKP